MIRKFKKHKVYSSSKDNTWGAELVDIQLISKYIKGIRFWLFGINVFSKYTWVVPLKAKKGITKTKAFQKKSDSGRKPNKIRGWQG